MSYYSQKQHSAYNKPYVILNKNTYKNASAYAEAPVKVAREATVQVCLTSGHTIEDCKAFK